MKKGKIIKVASLVGVLVSTGLAGCSDSESYSDLLRDEEKAVNWYLSGYRVETEIPADGKFITGEEVGEDNAPFYKMDAEGNVYMKVLRTGDMEDRPENGDRVYFLYTRWNIKNLYELGVSSTDSNVQTGNLGDYYFFLGDTSSSNGLLFGTGLQLPMTYLGYNSEVNLVLKSYQGFSIDQAECTPYILNVKYLKPEY